MHLQIKQSLKLGLDNSNSNNSISNNSNKIVVAITKMYKIIHLLIWKKVNRRVVILIYIVVACNSRDIIIKVIIQVAIIMLVEVVNKKKIQLYTLIN